MPLHLLLLEDGDLMKGVIRPHLRLLGLLVPLLVIAGLLLPLLLGVSWTTPRLTNDVLDLLSGHIGGLWGRPLVGDQPMELLLLGLQQTHPSVGPWPFFIGADDVIGLDE